MKDEDKTYENEVNIKQNFIENQKETIVDLKKEIDRLQESYNNLKIINEGHQKLNGELRIEVKKLTEKNEKLKDPLNQLRKDGDI
tara:strand:+ start:239 stop:493 length:255 start_codon:yes stop_codon:yes gene_type:complete